MTQLPCHICLSLSFELVKTHLFVWLIITCLLFTSGNIHMAVTLPEGCHVKIANQDRGADILHEEEIMNRLERCWCRSSPKANMSEFPIRGGYRGVDMLHVEINRCERWSSQTWHHPPAQMIWRQILPLCHSFPPFCPLVSSAASPAAH